VTAHPESFASGPARSTAVREFRSTAWKSDKSQPTSQETEPAARRREPALRGLDLTLAGRD
jgi:hypothetical protein